MNINPQLKTYNLKLIIAFIVLSVIGYQLLVAHAQTLNPVILTWQADNFYPADFAGKALPTPNTPITVSAEVLQNGKFLDLSKATFMWYVDENLVSRGDGQKEMTFKAQKASGDYHFVRVAIQSGNDSFENSLRIYIQSPKVVIENPYPNQLIRAGGQALLQAVPYFFNVKSIDKLDFSWFVNNNQTASGSDNQLLLNVGLPQTPDQNLVKLSATAQNNQNPFERGVGQSNLTID